MASQTSKIYFVLFLTFLLIAVNTPVNFIYWMCAALCALLILGYLLTLSNCGNMTLKRSYPETIFHGDTAEITLTLSNESPFVRLFLLVEEHCAYFKQKKSALQNSFLIPFFQRKQSISFNYSMTFPRRGVYALGPCKISSGWPLGLFLREKEIPQTSALYVLPRAIPLGDFYFSGTGQQIIAGAESSTKPGAGINIYGTREYRQGDSLSHIHWKSTAKRQTLIMKEFEGTGYTAPLLLLDLQAGTDAISENGDTALETAVILCASLAESFFAKRQPFFFIAQGSRRFFRYVDTDSMVYLNLLKDLAQVQCDGSMNFADVVSDETQLLGDGVSPVLISCSGHFWEQGFSTFINLSRWNGQPCAMVIDADSFMRTSSMSAKPSLFYESFLGLKQGGFQSYYISKHMPLKQALTGEIPIL